MYVFCTICIWCLFISDFLTIWSTQENIYTSLDDIPESEVWLVLWTSKYIADGRQNLFYIYRLDAAEDLYRDEKIEYILVSGDNSTQQYNETDSMIVDLVERGIPRERIYGDYAWFRTLDSIVRAKEVFGQESYTIITQKFHLQRAIFLAKNQWIEVIWYSARDVPVGRAPRVWVRERFARVKMMIDIVLWVEPKFLGEKIEIWE